MFCSYCGKEIPDNAEFCSYCGKRTSAVKKDQRNETKSVPPKGTNEYVQKAEDIFEKVQQTVQSKLGVEAVRDNDHPYRRLGGFLAVYAYASLIIGIGCILFVVLNIFNVRGLSQFFSIIVLCATAYWYIRLFMKIQKREVDFLGFYETFGIILYAAYAVFRIIVSGFLLGPYVIITIISTIAGGLPVYILTIVYFSKSVRVRTYFETDEYIKKSIFVKNSISPIPAVPDRK